MSFATAQLPIQSIPRSKKNNEWGKVVIDQFNGRILSDNYFNRASRTRKLVNYELFNGRLNQKDFMYVLNPYGLDSGEFPASMQHYDIISPKLMLLLGEEQKRPFNFIVRNVSSEVVRMKQEKTKEMLMQVLESKMPHATQDPNKPKVPDTPAHIQKYVNSSWTDDMSIAAQRISKYFTHKFNLKHHFNESFGDVLKVAEEIHWVGAQAGEPIVRLCNPVDISVVIDPDESRIENAEAVIEERWMTISSVLDEYYDILTSEEIEDLESAVGRMMVNGDTKSGSGTGGFNITWSTSTVDIGHRRGYNTSGNIRVLKVEWKSIKKVGILESTDEMGFPKSELVDETYSAPDDAVLTKSTYGTPYWTWENEEGIPTKLRFFKMNEVWEGVKIGENIVVQVRPKKVQRRDIDNPCRVKLGYTGYIYNSRNSQAVSFIDRAKPFQYLYDIIYYRTELAFAKNKGPIVLMDLAQLPKSQGIDMNKWLYYMEAMNVLFINSREDRDSANAFNQFQVLNAQMTQFINEHVNMLDKIKEELGELVGVSRQRQGQTVATETVGNSERAVTQSSHITEYWFARHDSVKREVMQALIDVARVTYRDEPNKVISYIGDDFEEIMFQFCGTDFGAASYGVFATNSDKDLQTLEAMKQLAQAGIQSGSVRFKDLVSLYRKDNIEEIARDLTTAQAEIDALNQQQQKSDDEYRNADLKVKQQMHLDEREDKALDRESKERTAIEVARINADSRSQSNEIEPDEDDTVYDDLERDKTNHQHSLDMQHLSLDQRKQQEVERANRKNEELKLKQINKKPTVSKK